MTLSRIKLGVVVIGIFVINTVNAQINRGYIKKYSTIDGLTENYINCIFQDSKGFIWIGTNDGLNKFNGYSFISYKLNPSGERYLPSNIIFNIQEDAKGNLWIGSTDAGVIKFNVDTEKYEHFFNNDSTPSIFTGNNVGQITLDKNRVWFINSTGLNLIVHDTIHNTYRFKKTHYNYSRLNVARNIVRDAHGQIWIGTNADIAAVKYDADNDSVLINRYSKKGNNYAVHTVTYKQGLLISFYPSLYYVQTTPGQHIKFNKLYDIELNKLLVDGNDNIWGANRQGLFKLEVDNDSVHIASVKNISHSNEVMSGTGIDISSLYCDFTGLIWAGTHGSGVQVYNPDIKKFRHHYIDNPQKTDANNLIRCIYEDSHNNLWIGSDGAGIIHIPAIVGNNYQIPSEDNKVKKFDFETKSFYAFTEFADKNAQPQIWVGTGYPHKLMKFPLVHFEEAEQLKFQQIEIDGAIFSLLSDSNKGLWVGSYSHGLSHFSYGENGLKKQLFVQHQQNTLPSNIIRSIFEDSRGNIWVGTGKGLSKMPALDQTESKRKFVNYTHSPDDASSISHNYILPIMETSAGEIWIGTMGGGLNRVIRGNNYNNDSFECFTTQDGLPNNVIKAILEDDLGNLWISTNRGLSKFNPKSKVFKNYDIHDGLQDYEFMELSACKRHDGEMLFGGVNGYNAFYPNEIVDDQKKPKIALTDFQLLYHKLPIGKEINKRVILERNINATTHLNLKHNENTFAITFSALHFVAPEKNQYKYILEGFNNEWIKVNSDNRTAQYTNISPGTYIFKVIACNNDGIWNETPKELVIRIDAPFWLKWYAFCFYALLLASLIVFMLKYSIIRNQKKSELLMERFEKEKSNELSKLKLDFFTSISHEFRTPLTLIMGMMDKLLSQPEIIQSEQNIKSSKLIRRNINILLRLIKQLADFRKHEQGKLDLIATHNNICEMLEQVYSSFENIAVQKQISFKQNIPSGKIMIWYDPDKVEKVLFNLISNALKFTPEQGEILVNLKDFEDKVEISVKDSGIGIDEDRQKNIFELFYQANKLKSMGTGVGLSFSKKLVEMHRGELAFVSKKAKGSTFTLTLLKGNSHFKKHEISNNPEQSQLVENLSSNKEWTEPVAVQFNSTNTNDEYGVDKKRKVLVVEDNVDVRLFIKDTLINNYNVLEAGDGEQGLQLAKDNNPDIVISDVMMPKMDGYQFCKSLKTDIETSHIPIILLTAKTSEEHKRIGLSEGADVYMEKPFGTDILIVQVESILQSRMLMWENFKRRADLHINAISTTKTDNSFISQVVKYVEENIADSEFSVEQLVSNFNISDVTLNKKLKALTGRTANSFIRLLRLKKAAELLQNDLLTVAEITYKVGFNDLKYFRECFKKEFDLTPSEYRKTLES